MKRYIALMLFMLMFRTSAFSFMPSLGHIPTGALKEADVKSLYASDPSPAIYFTGAGIYLWWQLGAVKYMQEQWDREDLKNAIMMGASAGSVSAAFLLLAADVEKAPKLAIDIANRNDLFSRKAGLTGVCGDLMRAWLNEMITDEIDMTDLKNLHVAVTGSKGYSKIIKDFENKDDLINGLLTSCHVPFFMDGKPVTTYKGEQFFDGAFWYFVTKNRRSGLPYPEQVDPMKTLFVDYGDDEEFLQSISGNFLELPTTPNAVYDMMESGYNFIKREEYYGRTPLLKRKNSILFRSVTSSIYSKLGAAAKIPEGLLSISSPFQNIRLPSFAK